MVLKYRVVIALRNTKNIHSLNLGIPLFISWTNTDNFSCPVWIFVLRHYMSHLMEFHW